MTNESLKHENGAVEYYVSFNWLVKTATWNRKFQGVSKNLTKNLTIHSQK